MKNIGIKKLKHLAQEKQLSQADIAKIAGITQGAISHYFTGRRIKVDPTIALRLHKAFPEIDLEDFLKAA